MNVEKTSSKYHRIGVILCIASIILPCWSKTSVSSDKNVESIQGYFLLNITQKLSEDFNRTYNEELGISFIKVSVLKVNCNSYNAASYVLENLRYIQLCGGSTRSKQSTS